MAQKGLQEPEMTGNGDDNDDGDNSNDENDDVGEQSNGMASLLSLVIRQSLKGGLCMSAGQKKLCSMSTRFRTVQCNVIQSLPNFPLQTQFFGRGNDTFLKLSNYWKLKYVNSNFFWLY